MNKLKQAYTFIKSFNFNKYKIEITVFLSSSLIMIFEIIGSRALAPYFGQSIYVWTSLIGVVMLSLAYGYYVGGLLADKNKNLKKVLSFVLLFAGITTFLSTIFSDILLSLQMFKYADFRLTVLTYSIILFGPTSVLLGVIYPLCYKLKITDLEKTGQQFGSLYAISTFGSFIGTFLSGYIMISYFGTKEILAIVSFLLVFLSLIYEKSILKVKVITILVLALISFIYFANANIFSNNFLIKRHKTAEKINTYETIYNRVSIVENSTVREMLLGVQRASGVNLNTKYSSFDYSNKLSVFNSINQNPKSFLVIGGAGYTYPKILMDSYPSAQIHVVEIDGGLLPLAKKYFYFQETDNFQSFVEDGRVFINSNNNLYDVIFLDAYGANLIPFQLTTVEFLDKLYKATTENGLIVSNIISSLEGPNSLMLKSSYKTFSEVFPDVNVIKVRSDSNNTMLDNYILIATKKETNLDSLDTVKLNLNEGIILTDNFSPTEKFQIW